MKKILLSLLLCICLFSVSCFATTMTESEIKTAFNTSAENFTDNSQYMYFNLSEIQSTIQTYITDYEVSDTLSSNYIVYVYNDDQDYFKYYNLGSSTIDSITTTEFTITINFSGSVDYYSGYCMEGEVDCFEHYSRNSITMSTSTTTTGNTFDTVFTYSSNAIFTEPSGGGLFDNIIGVMTSILSVIVPVATALLAIPLFKFIIYASVALGIIYFVIKLLKSFTGNKFGGGFESNIDRHNEKLYRQYKSGKISKEYFENHLIG